MLFQKKIIFLFAQFSLYAVGDAIFHFPAMDWINRLDNNDHHHGQKVEQFQFQKKPEKKTGQEIENYFFEPSQNHRGQEIEEINFGHKPHHERGQEVEKINFGQKPEKGQEIEEINFGHKPQHERGQEVEEINFGHKPHHERGQEVEEINFGHKPERGQEVEEINFGHKPERGQEVEEINFGQKPEKGQEIEKINFGHNPERGQEVEEINFGQKPEKGQEIEEVHFGQMPDHENGQKAEEINFGQKPEKGQEIEEINFGHKPDPENDNKNKDEHNTQKENDNKNEETVENSESNWPWFEIFSPSSDSEDCEEIPSTLSNSFIKCESKRKCELFCIEGYRFSNGFEKVIFECDHGKWITIDNVTAECNPVCEPPCQNNGVCAGNNQCICPKNFQGAYCQYLHKPCSDTPPVAQNSYVNCNSSDCIVKCFDNYAFPDGTSTMNLICHHGQWKLAEKDWNSVPDCSPSCEPPCVNGGSCLDFNKCQCPRNYAGPQCQYEISICDAKKLNFNGFYTCRGENDKVVCSISCPEGQKTDVPIAKEYICNYSDGKFLPEPVPKCLYDKNTEILKFQSSSHTIQGGHEGFKISQTPSPVTGECFSWKKSHYKNFDGEIFSFDGDCSYIMAQDVENTFRIIFENSKCEFSSECSRTLKIHYEENDHVVRFEGTKPILTVNGRIIEIPTQLNGFLMEKIGDKISISLLTVDVNIEWDLKDHFTISINENLWDKTRGLCGNFNGNPNDDFLTPDNSVAGNLETFIQSWVTDPYNCESIPSVKNNCTDDNNIDYCREIFTNSHFEKCTNSGKFSLFQEACVWDLCKCGKNCVCDTISEFVKNCKKFLLQKGIPDSTSDWREITDCRLNCDNGKIYSVCGSPLQPSCGSFEMKKNIAKYSECVEGCFCPEGMVQFNNSCIRKENCPCYWRNSYYGREEKIMKDCNSCTCQNGEWICTNLQCNSRCSVIGGSHYLTFDGRRYDLTTQCDYYLFKSLDYSISTRNLPCEGDVMNEIFHNYFSKYSSCAKLITIKHKTDEIKLKMRMEVFLNEMEVNYFPLEVNGIKIRTTSHYVIVTFPDGIELWWDGNSNVYIDIPGNYKQLTGGLCGTFNNNQKDDFKTPEGDIEQTAPSFAQKWKTDETCTEITHSVITHPCDDNFNYKEIAEKQCQKLKSKIFEECHPLVDVNPFYKNCLYDICSCQKDIKSCLCSVFSDYASECARQSVEVPWRNQMRECGKQCQKGLHCQNGEIYQPCGDSCSKSCKDISIMNDTCERKCVDGCSCPEGLTLNSEGQCIPISECPCFHQNIKYKPNHEIIMEGETPQLCTCQNALWSCKPATPLDIARDYENNDYKCDEKIHEEYTNCKPAEPKTCKNMHERTKPSSRICFPGCVCKKGFVWDSLGKICVNASECPCHHGGRSYGNGEKIQQECNSCVCQNGVWLCSERECSSMCSTWGDSHFKTFDGKIYDFQGSCEFVLAAGSISEFDSFFISLQIVPCGTTGISCPKSLTLTVQSQGNEEKVIFKKSKQFKIPKGLERILIREVGLFIFAEVFDLGITIQWDKGTRVYVKADARWKNKVKGLCGNFNDDELDDFKTPSSGETNEISPVLFADSWRLESYCPESNPITNTCARRPHRKSWAVEKCSILNSELFEPCHSEVPLEPYLERCVVDTCGCDEGGDCDCMCTAVAAYAEECTLKGIPIKWRSQHHCPIQCEDDTNYNPCISKCPPKSCDNQYQHSAVLRTCSEESCTEGCDRIHCPPGHVLAHSSSNHCVPITSCKTVCLTVNNVTFLEGDLMESDDCHSCFCSHHKKICTGEPCSAITTTPTPTTTSGCPEGEIWDDCIVSCNHICNNLASSINTTSELQCSIATDCISGCRLIDLNCPDGMFLRDKHTCLKKKDCPCVSPSHSLVKPGDVVQESECEKCQCVNNEYVCINVCTTPIVVPTVEPVYNYSKEVYTSSPGWDYIQEGNVTLIYRPTTREPISCETGNYESLIDFLTQFSASSHLDEFSLPSFGEISSKGAWTAGNNNADQYLQVDLLKVEPIYAVNVAGQSGNYVTSYYLLYSLDGLKFKYLFNNDGQKEIFGGPFNGHQSVKQVLPVPIEARYIRFHPVSWHGQISMKVDVLGCKSVSTPSPPLPSICNKPIGIGQKYFPKLQIIATSSKPNNGPTFIGFDNEKGWQPLTNSKSEWVEFDFGDLVNFTGIITKGVSQGNDLSSPSGESWVERYQIEYSHDGISWNPILDEFGDKMTFFGNTDGETEKKNIFKRPIRAKALKILPVKWHENIVLRLDLLGCYEPTHLEVQVTPPIVIPKRECNLCPGVVFTKEDCNCKENEWWNGENCIDHTECPCFNGLISYPVGSTFTTENCEECICRLYGLPLCTPKYCPDCPHGLQKTLTPLCGCSCKPCKENTRLCPTSNICLEETAWCDGIQDCPDDEINCTTRAPPKVTPTSSPCVVTCPPGYDIVYRNKTAGPTEADDMIRSHRIKSVKTSVKTYRKSKKSKKSQKLMECPPYDCVPVEEVPKNECPTPQCPLDYLIVYQNHNEAKEESCLLYTCEPKPEYANCSVLSKNIKTFDGLNYKFEICDHVLTTHDSGLYNITAYKNCTFGASCTTVLLINHGEHSLELNPHHRLIKFDSFLYTTQQAELFSSKMTDFTINVIGDTIIFFSDIYGFEVIYDANGNLNIKVPGYAKGHLGGLCGFYNGNPDDDKTLPGGKLSKTIVEFGDSWHNPGGKKCLEIVCPIEMQNSALEICLKLKDKPFNLCDTNVNLELCIESVCDCLATNETIDDCKCRVLSDFASKCKNANLFGWRMEHDCPASCPSNLVHYDCYPYTCQPKCGNEECIEPATDCYSGCFCQDGLVKKGDHCVKVLECRDCVCSGLGDSTYLTFDGGLTFNGNCTYVATREKSLTGVPGFQVFISNSLCNGSDFKTCTDKVEVTVPGHSIKITALPGTQEMVMILIDDEKGNFHEGQTLDKVWSRIKLNREVSVVEVELPWEHVDVRFFYKKFTFSISLPSHLYSGKLEGLCGTCEQSKEPEEMDDPEKWQTEHDKSCLIEPPPQCEPTAEQKEICSRLNDPKTFGQCVAFVDPSPFIDQCLTSLCNDGHFCDSFEAYGQACREGGVCVDWRSESLCHITCPSGLEYHPCNLGCQKTCDNFDEIVATCKNTPVEGCFCPIDEVLINGTCKSEKYCEFCDENGQHFEDESWQLDKCTNCSCRNHVVTCEKTECPELDITCEDYEILSKEENEFECCPKHKCVCQPRDACPMIDIPTNLLPGMEAVVNESGCCPRVEMICHREKCPEVKPCRQHFIQKIQNATECCPEVTCEKPDNICIYEFNGHTSNGKRLTERDTKTEVVKEIGERWTDGPCKSCVCVDKDSFAEVVCTVTECSSLKDHHDYYDYALEEVHDPEKCCPDVVRISCKHNERIYKVGDSWVPDENNPCETMKCNDWSGIIKKETRLEMCNENCDKGWEYKHLEGACCGHCVQMGCLANDTIYNSGDIWFSENNCAKSTCQQHNGHFSIITETKSCEPVEDCRQEDIYHDGCCLKCKPRGEDKKNCDVKYLPLESTIELIKQRKGKHGNCRNVKPVSNFTQCAGNCDSHTVFKRDNWSHETVCKCCAPEEYSIISVPLKCDDGADLTKTITIPSKCSCMPCGG